MLGLLYEVDDLFPQVAALALALEVVDALFELLVLDSQLVHARLAHLNIWIESTQDGCIKHDGWAD
jgi:hypothetical protein